MTDDKRQEHLGNFNRNFAVFLPAISNFYNTFISKQRVTEGAHIPKERIPINNKFLTFLLRILSFRSRPASASGFSELRFFIVFF